MGLPMSSEKFAIVALSSLLSFFGSIPWFDCKRPSLRPDLPPAERRAQRLSRMPLLRHRPRRREASWTASSTALAWRQVGTTWRPCDWGRSA